MVMTCTKRCPTSSFALTAGARRRVRSGATRGVSGSDLQCDATCPPMAAEAQIATEGSARRGAGLKSPTPTTLGDVLRLCCSGWGSVEAGTCGFVTISAQVYSALGRAARWERDESSHVVTAAPPDAGMSS
jgi:hypothetical protein